MKIGLKSDNVDSNWLDSMKSNKGFILLLWCLKAFYFHLEETLRAVLHALTQVRLFSADPEADQGGAAAFQRGGGDAEVPAAPQHRPLPRLLEVDGEGPQMHHPGDGTDDVGHAQNVSICP